MCAFRAALHRNHVAFCMIFWSTTHTVGAHLSPQKRIKILLPSPAILPRCSLSAVTRLSAVRSHDGGRRVRFSILDDQAGWFFANYRKRAEPAGYWHVSRKRRGVLGYVAQSAKGDRQKVLSKYINSSIRVGLMLKCGCAPLSGIILLDGRSSEGPGGGNRS